MFYKLVIIIIVPFLKLFFRLKRFGTENIPKKGGIIIAANHVSYLDPIVLGVTCPRLIIFMILERYYNISLIGWGCRRIGCFPVKQDKVDAAAIKNSLKTLKEGKPLGIFPEGGRSKDGKLEKGKAGVAMLALRSGVPVIPVGIKGTYEAYPRQAKFPKPKPVSVHYGKPMYFGDFADKNSDKDVLNTVTEMIMKEIGELLK